MYTHTYSPYIYIYIYIHILHILQRRLHPGGRAAAAHGDTSAHIYEPLSLSIYIYIYIHIRMIHIYIYIYIYSMSTRRSVFIISNRKISN